MNWNYRVVKISYRERAMYNRAPGSEIFVYDVRNVYYREDQPVAIGRDNVSPQGEDREDILASHQKYNEAFAKPVLCFSWDDEKFTGEEPALGNLMQEDRDSEQRWANDYHRQAEKLAAELEKTRKALRAVLEEAVRQEPFADEEGTAILNNGFAALDTPTEHTA